MENAAPTTQASQLNQSAEGAHVTGNVNTEGGDFVGRNKNIRSVITGRDVIGSLLITGDHNQVFISDYQRFQDAYISPSSVFDRVNLEHFTGREWLVAEVDDFLQTYDRGYFILEADAGLGKTTFMAWLAKERHYIHHFSELAPNQEGIALRNLAAQLALAYELLPKGVLPSAATRPDYFYDLLKQAAIHRHQDEKIVLVVDALDEAGTPINQNALGLPMVLPEGTYVIVSQRPIAVALRVDTASTPCYRVSLVAADSQNQADMKRFLERAATWPRIVQVLQENHYTPEQFTTTLLDKCRGVWIYLHYVVHEIERGERSLLALSTLPNGMTQYYAQYWQRWRDADETEWDSWYLPLLTILAAAQEALSCQQLLVWLGVKRTERTLRRLLEERWRPFLTIEQSGTEHRYRFYHATLQEFFDGRLVQDNLSSAELALVVELTEATRSCHTRLAERYLQVWGGLAAGLPGLQEAIKRDLDERYGLRHLSSHLAAAGRVDDLHHLLRIEWIYYKETVTQLGEEQTDSEQLHEKERAGQIKAYRNVWYTVRETTGQTDGYLADVVRAWHLTEEYRSDETNTNRLKPSEGRGENRRSQWLGLQCRYALIVASLNSLAKNILPELLTELVKKQVWLPQQGLIYARQMPDLAQGSSALAKLAPHLREVEHEQILQEALATARSINYDISRTEALANLIPHLHGVEHEQILQEALATTRSINYDTSRIEALTNLIPHLRGIERGQVLQEALATVKIIGSDFSRVSALAKLAPHLPSECLQEALVIARNIDDSAYRAEALANLTPRLHGIEREQVLQEALATARSIKNRSSRTSALVKLSAQLTELGLLEEALTTAEGINNNYSRAFSMVKLAVRLAELGQLQEALSIANSIEDRYSSTKVIAELLPYFSGVEQKQVLHEALIKARSIENHAYRTSALATLAGRLAELDQYQESLIVAKNIEDKFVYAKTISKIASYLSSEQLQEVLTIVRIINDSFPRGQAIVILATQLAELGQWQEALSVAKSIDNSFARVSALASMLPYFSGIEREQILHEALTIIKTIKDSHSLSEIMYKLTPYLSSAHLQETLTPVRNIDSSPFQMDALVKLISRVSGIERERILHEALATARSIKHSFSRVSALASLLPYFSKIEHEQILQEMLVAARSIEIRSSRASVLVSLLPHLSEIEQEQVLQEALNVAKRIDDQSFRTSALIKLATQLTDLGRWQEALSITKNIDDNSSRIEALITLLPHLSEIEQEQVLQEALNVAKRIDNQSFRTSALIKLATQLTDLGRWQEALSITKNIDDNSSRIEALITLLPYFSGIEQEQVLRETLSVAKRIDNQSFRTSALIKLATQLTDLGQWQEALNVAKSIDDKFFCTSALTNLLPYLSGIEREQVLQETLATARSIDYSISRAEALANLTPYLFGVEQEQALQEALSIVKNSKFSAYRTSILDKLTPYLSSKQCQDALSIAKSIYDKSFRAYALINLLPLFSGIEQEQVMQEAMTTARRIDSGYSRMPVLAKLATQLAELGRLQEALVVAKNIDDNFSRASVLANLATWLVKLPLNDLYAIWCKTLPLLASGTRADLVTELAALVVLISHMGGVSAIAETTQAIRDVGCWWP